MWDSEDLETVEVCESVEVEELAMHLDPDSLVDPEPGPRWSDLTDEQDDDPVDDAPVSYFADEQPEDERADARRNGRANGVAADDELDELDGADEPDDAEPDLEELLERQHYAFPSASTDD